MTANRFSRELLCKHAAGFRLTSRQANVRVPAELPGENSRKSRHEQFSERNPALQGGSASLLLCPATVAQCSCWGPAKARHFPSVSRDLSGVAPRLTGAPGLGHNILPFAAIVQVKRQHSVRVRSGRWVVAFLGSLLATARANRTESQGLPWEHRETIACRSVRFLWFGSAVDRSRAVEAA
jgi:hypothetical protein